MAEMKPKDATGCLLCVWGMLVVSPLWFVILHALLVASNAPVYAWCCFFAYMPAHILGVVLAYFVRTMQESK